MTEKMTTTKVGSHVDIITFNGANIPIGFLASMRKKLHGPCKKLNGFVERLMPGQGMAKVVCSCAVARANQKMRQVGVPHLETLGREWAAREMERVAESERACEDEGFKAAEDAQNPYPAMTDQALAWQKGHARKGGAATPDVPSQEAAPKAEVAGQEEA